MLKAVIYYGRTRDIFNFTEEKFKPLNSCFTNVNFVYVNDINEFEKEIIDADFILARKISEKQFFVTKKLKALFVYSAGREAIPSVVIENIRCYFGHFHGQLMAESLLAAILYFNQQYLHIMELQKNKKWGQTEQFIERRTLSEQKIAIIGYGTIGRYCAKVLNNFGLKIYAVQRSIGSGNCGQTGATFVKLTDLKKLLPEINHIVSILPYSEESINYFNAAFFNFLSPNTYFYSLGRGHCVNENDLIDALNNKRLAGAMLDVVNTEPLTENSPLWEVKNLFISPHISAFYHNYIDLYIEELVNQIKEELSLVSF